MPRRPSIPVGTTINGANAVAGVLAAEDAYELYLLAESSGSFTHLMLIRDQQCDVVAWLQSQGNGIIQQSESLPPLRGVSASNTFALSLKGKCLGSTNLRNASERELIRAFANIGMLASKIASSDAIPRFDASLIWQSDDGSEFASLLPRSPEFAESAVRVCARGFFEISTGTVMTSTANRQQLSHWCKFAGVKLTDIVERCLETPTSKKAIKTIDELLNALQNLETMHDDAGVRSLSTVSKGGGLASVAGMKELKELLERDVIKPIRDPEPYRRYGLTVPNGILLFGPPGCGKTYIARQLAEELGHHFIELIPSEVASPFIHSTVLKIRDAFEQAAAESPAILFIDEFEALVPARADLSGHQQFKAEEVNEFLAQLNECAAKRILVVAATNEPQKIDNAVKRSGRLDKLIYVGPPDCEARIEMLLHHLKGRPSTLDETDISTCASKLGGYSASDIRLLIDEAAREALASREPISGRILSSAMRKVPASISPDVEILYSAYQQRGF